MTTPEPTPRVIFDPDARVIAVVPSLAGTLTKPPLSKNQIYQAINAEELPTYRVGLRNFVLVADLVEWITRAGPIPRGRGRPRKQTNPPSAQE